MFQSWAITVVLLMVQSLRLPTETRAFAKGTFSINGEKKDRIDNFVGQNFSANCSTNFFNPPVDGFMYFKSIEEDQPGTLFDNRTLGIVDFVSDKIGEKVIHCYYKKSGGELRWLQTLHIYTYPRIIMPTRLDAISPNWEGLDVSWCSINKKNRYLNDEKTQNMNFNVRWSMEYRIRSSSHEVFSECPKKGTREDGKDCTCFFEEYGIDFIRNSHYEFKIHGRSRGGVNSTMLVISTNSAIVKPNLMYYLNASEINPHSIMVEWMSPKMLEPNILKLRYQIYVSLVNAKKYPELKKFRVFEVPPPDVSSVKHPIIFKNILDMQPGASYIVSIRGIPTVNNSFWSDFKNKTIKMSEIAPSRNPETSVGGYSSTLAKQETRRNVRIYYKDIPPRYGNGEIKKFIAKYRHVGQDEPDFQVDCDLKYYCDLNGLDINKKYSVEIKGRNSFGFGPHKMYSKFELPPYDYVQADKPTGFTSEYMKNGSMLFSWKSPKRPPAYYIIYYCKDSQSVTCKSGIFWRKVNGTLSSVYIDGVNKTFIYSLASVSEHGTSKGMTVWSICSYKYDDTGPINAPQVNKAQDHVAGGLKVEWIKATCSYTDPYILKYIVRWREVSASGKSLNDNEKYVSVDSEKSYFVIPDVKPLAYYNVSLSIKTRTRETRGTFVKMQTEAETIPSSNIEVIVPTVILPIFILIICFSVYIWWSKIPRIEIKVPEVEEEELPSLHGPDRKVTDSSPMITVERGMNQPGEDIDTFDDCRPMLKSVSLKMENRHNYYSKGRQISGDSGTASLMSCSTQQSYLPGTTVDTDEQHTPTSHNSSFGQQSDHDKKPTSTAQDSGYFRFGPTNSSNTATTYLSDSPVPPVAVVGMSGKPDPIPVHCVRFHNPYLPVTVLGGLPKVLESTDEEEKKKQQQMKLQEENEEAETTFNQNDLPAEYSKVTGIASSDEAICIDSENEGSERSIEQHKTSFSSLNTKNSPPPLAMQRSWSHEKGLNDVNHLKPKQDLFTPYVKDIDISRANKGISPYVQIGKEGNVSPFVSTGNLNKCSSLDSGPPTPEVVDANPFNSSILPSLSGVTPSQSTTSQPDMSDTDLSSQTPDSSVEPLQVTPMLSGGGNIVYQAQVFPSLNAEEPKCHAENNNTDSSNSGTSTDSSRTLCNGCTSSGGSQSTSGNSQFNGGDGGPAVLNVNSSDYVSETHPCVNGHSKENVNDGNMNRLQVSNCRNNKPPVNGYLPPNSVWQV